MERKLKIMENEKHPLDDLKNDERYALFLKNVFPLGKRKEIAARFQIRYRRDADGQPRFARTRQKRFVPDVQAVEPAQQQRARLVDFFIPTADQHSFFSVFTRPSRTRAKP